MKQLTKIFAIVTLAFSPMIACADLAYNPDHDEALENLASIETAMLNSQYQCGKHSLIISAHTTQSEVNGRKASVTGKIISESNTHDISEQLTKAISKQDILKGLMSVACSPKFGAFEIKFTPNDYANLAPWTTVVYIFSDGTVEGSRSQ